MPSWISRSARAAVLLAVATSCGPAAAPGRIEPLPADAVGEPPMQRHTEPMFAIPAGIDDTVLTLEFIVGLDGHPERESIRFIDARQRTRSFPQAPGFLAEVREAVTQWRYQPGTHLGRPVRVLVSQPIIRRRPSVDSVASFLLDAAAGDFHAHRPPDPVRFRDVRLGHVSTPGGEPQYLLCGQFLPAQTEGEAEWIPFATIRTSGYEQWTGAQAEGFCRQASVTWDETGDLSSRLMDRLAALR